MTTPRLSQPSSTGLTIEKAIEEYEELQRMMHRTVGSLLNCFDEEKKVFYSSVQEGVEAKATSLDTAIVLAEIEGAAADVMDRTATRDEYTSAKHLIKRLEENRLAQKVEPISYEAYQHHFFQPCLSKMATHTPEDVLGRKQDPTPRGGSLEYRNPFTSSRVLTLLNFYSKHETHGKVWVEAVESVIDALTRPYAPNYAFGGASLTGTDAHAFVSHYCLQSLLGIVKILRNRKQEHCNVARLLREIANWSESASSTIRIQFKEKADFRRYLSESLESFKAAVGLETLVCTMQGAIEADMPPKVLLEKIRNDITDSDNGVFGWLHGFKELVEEQLTSLSGGIREQLHELSETEKAVGASGHDYSAMPGAASMTQQKDYMRCAGLNWERAFFQAMWSTLDKMEKVYALTLQARPVSLASVAKAIEDVGEIWAQSGERTERYIATFSKWATADLYRQISLYSVRYNTNFDPTQLAFSLRIYHEFSPEKNPELVRKGLEILLESQQPDGTWPVGAPLLFQSADVMAVYVANLEIVNAVMPLITEAGGLAAHHQCLQRIFNWLKTNRREVVSSSTGNPAGGWPTDKVMERGRIDVWMTALALHFLNDYKKLLRDFMNQSIFGDRNYDVTAPGKLKLAWASVADPELGKRYEDRVKYKIYEWYIKPFQQTGESRNSAMILYGPPGTAKTTLAQALAKELTWDLVTITPSDFVKEGIEKSESMARLLFQDLLRLRGVVVLLDEIDEMLRSRSEAQNGDGKEPSGIAMLRFLVPGMLPKLQRLKQYGEKAKVIFVIATNYRDRLDPAVVRSGRIDHSFLILPPDRPSREYLLREMIGRKGPLGTDEKPSQQLSAHLAKVTQGWVYKEIETLVETLDREFFCKPMQKEELLKRVAGPAELNEILGIQEKQGELLVLEGNTVFSGREFQVKRSLDPVALYENGERTAAEDEAKEVLGICGATDDDIRRMIDKTKGISSDKARGPTLEQRAG